MEEKHKLDSRENQLLQDMLIPYKRVDKSIALAVRDDALERSGKL